MDNAADIASMTPRECLAFAREIGLGSRRAEERQRAEAAIRAMGDGAVPFLANVLDEARVRRSKQQQAAQLAILAPSLLAVMAGWLGWRDMTISSAWVSFLAMFGGLLAAVRISLDSRLEDFGTQLLMRIADKRAVNTLLKATSDSSARVHGAARSVLTKLLAQFRASDAPLLSDESRRSLVWLMNRISVGEASFRRDDIAYALAALACLEQVGEPRALDAVARIARGDNLPSAALTIRNAAREALPAFERAAEADRIAGTLLRPVVSAEDGSALLRPVSASVAEDESVLVRPAEGGGA